MEEKILNLKENLKNPDYIKKFFTGEAFVTFQFQEEKEEMIRNYQLHFWQNKLKKLRVKQACLPDDVIWTHYGLPLGKKFFWRTFSFLIAFGIIIFGFYVAIKIAIYELDIKEVQSGLVYPLIISGIVTLINLILRLALIKSTNLEYR